MSGSGSTLFGVVPLFADTASLVIPGTVVPTGRDEGGGVELVGRANATTNKKVTNVWYGRRVEGFDVGAKRD